MLKEVVLMLKGLCHGLLISCFVLFSAFPVLSSEGDKGPKAVITEPEFDFKDVKQGETVEHTFTIVNRGAGVLKVLNVRVG